MAAAPVPIEDKEKEYGYLTPAHSLRCLLFDAHTFWLFDACTFAALYDAHTSWLFDAYTFAALFDAHTFWLFDAYLHLRCAI